MLINGELLVFMNEISRHMCMGEQVLLTVLFCARTLGAIPKYQSRIIFFCSPADSTFVGGNTRTRSWLLELRMKFSLPLHLLDGPSRFREKEEQAKIDERKDYLRANHYSS